MTCPVFFDLYNTLLRFDYSVLPSVELDGRPYPTTMVAVQTALRQQLGLDCPVEDLLRTALDSRRQLARQRGPQHREYPSLHRFQLVARQLGLDSPRVPEVMVEAHMEAMFQMMFCPPETLQVLQKLSSRRLFVASNFDHAATARRALREFGLMGFFQQVFISIELGWRKPGERFFREIAERSGVSPRDAIFIGDDPVADIEGAGNVGFTTVWLRDSHFESEPAPPPRWQIQHLAELPDLLG